MTAQLIDGAAIQRRILERAAKARADAGVVPEIALIMVEGDDPLTAVNFRLHQRVFAAAGFVVRPIVLPGQTDRAALLGMIERLNDEPDLDAIMTLLPLPDHLDIRDVLATVDPDKEVEGLHLAHVMRFNPLSALPPVRPPVVPLTVLTLLAEAGFDPAARQVVVLVDPVLMERNPVAKMVARVGAMSILPPDAIGSVVPLGHPRASQLCREADLLIVSLDRPGVVDADWIKPGAFVVDFNAMVHGMRPHPTDPQRSVPILVGGVDVASVATVAGTVSPIPGGIGPVMLAVLVEQIVAVAAAREARTASAAGR